MPTRVEKLSLEDGGCVLVEVYDVGVEGAVERVAVQDKAAKTFEAAWDTITPLIHSLSKKIVALGPTETQIKFGIRVAADLNAIIASTKGEANFEVTLSWKPYKQLSVAGMKEGVNDDMDRGTGDQRVNGSIP